MIKLNNLETYGWEAAVRGMRNPMNSWDMSDSEWCKADEEIVDKRSIPIMCSVQDDTYVYMLGPRDQKLMKQLRNAGTDHRKFMRMITMYVDITAPLYWWKEFDTYKVGTVANSCSTMHKIAAKKFTIGDFSHEHLLGIDAKAITDVFGNGYSGYGKDSTTDKLTAIDIDGHTCFYSPRGFIRMTCDVLNHYRDLYLETKDKTYWWQMIQLLPSSYNQKRTVAMNYEVLANIYKSRKNHKLDEWRIFCNTIEENFPYSELITGLFKEADSNEHDK